MKHLFIIIISLLLLNFFGAFFIYSEILLGGLVLPFAIIKIRKEYLFKKYIYILLIGIFISIFSCNFFRGQSLYLSIKANYPYFFILFYFTLLSLNFSVKTTEKALIYLIILFCISYIIQYLVYPKVIFRGALAEYSEDVRIRLTGQGLVFLGYFYGINKFLSDKNNKVFYLILSVLCILIIFLLGFRTQIVLIIPFTYFLIFKIKGFNRKVFLISIGILLFFLSLSIIPVVKDKIEFMQERQETEKFSRKDYIRVIDFQYYTHEHFHNIWEYILGSGSPFPGTEYNYYMSGLKDKYMYYEDLGLLGLSWIIGIFPVVIMLLYSFKAYRLPLPNDYKYLGIWFIYLIAISFTTMEFYREGNFVVQALVLFLIEKIYKEEKSLQQIVLSNFLQSIK